jgi:hypothetical protein
MRQNLRDRLLLTAQAHGLYLRLRERVELDARLEPVAHHAYSRYQRRLSGGYHH